MSVQLLQQLSVSLLLVAGDSIGVGAGASSPSLSYASLLHHNDARAWPKATGHDLTMAGGAAVQQLNLSRSGATTADTLARVRRHLGEHPGPLTAGHAVVTVTTGGNDLKNSFLGAMMAKAPGQRAAIMASALQKTRADVATLCDVLQDGARFPGGVTVMLANVYDPSDGKDWVASPYGTFKMPGLAQTLRQWNAALKQVAQEHHAIVVDAHAAFHGHGYVGPETAGGSSVGIAESWFADPIHPNDRGHHALRELFFAALTQRGDQKRNAATP
jgi:lysophospholipase L1-like esterase